MATYTSLNEANAAVAVNLDWRSTGSVSKANALVEAIAYLRIFRVQSGSGGGNSLAYDSGALESMAKEATAFVRSRSGNGGVVYPDLNEGFRR